MNSEELTWIIPSVMALILWGIWGFLAKLSSELVDWKKYMAVAGIIYLALSLTLIIAYKIDLTQNVRGVLMSAAATIAGSIGTIFLYIALEREKASIVIPFTALYPAITAILSILLLGERPSLPQILGIFLACISVVLLAGKS